MIKTIDLQPVPSQVRRLSIDGYNLQLNLYQKEQGLFIDINVDGVDICTGIICRNSVYLNAKPYGAFKGQVAIVDTAGDEDPEYSGLNSRWVLFYIPEADLP